MVSGGEKGSENNLEGLHLNENSSIPIVLTSDNERTPAFNISALSNRSNGQPPRRGGGGGGGGNGRNDPPSEEDRVRPPFPSNDSNLSAFRRGKVRNMPSYLALFGDDGAISVDGTPLGKKHLQLRRQNRPTATFDFNFTEDVDFGVVSTDSDSASGKVFLHAPRGLLSNISLFVPRLGNETHILICSNASRFDQIVDDCGTLPEVTRRELIEVSSLRVTLSDDGLFYIVSGITGTGAQGVNVTVISTGTAPSAPPSNLSAQAGNVTEMLIGQSRSTTQSWQGYFGNISGAITLADGSDNVLYNWSLFSPTGEVYASTNSSILWSQLTCFNFTATGSLGDDSAQAGSTSLFGYNLTRLENQFGIVSNDLDGVDETFTLLGTGTHDLFFIGGNSFSEGECPNTRIFSNAGLGETNKFEEILLYEPVTTSIVFTTLIEEDVLGFDNRTHDFEFMVLENGHGTDVATTTYYFFAELQ